MRFAPITASLALSLAAIDARGAVANDATLLSLRRIWNAAPHNAFTDLAKFNGQYYVTFREASEHSVPPAGTDGGDLRVIRSSSGTSFSSAALIDFGVDHDLRDPKLAVTPDGRMMLLGTDAPQAGGLRQSYVWYSNNGTAFGAPTAAADPGRWLWRIEWSGVRAYGLSYTGGATRLGASFDGANFSTLVTTLTSGNTNEAAFVVRRDGSAVALVRDEDGNAAVGTSAGADFSRWTFRESNYFVGGPDMVELPDGRLVVGGRFTDEATKHTKLAFLDPATGALQPFLTLTSSGDTGYPGLLWDDDKLWVSYYSSHQGKASIYLATVAFANVPEPTSSAAGFGLLLIAARRGRVRR